MAARATAPAVRPRAMPHVRERGSNPKVQAWMKANGITDGEGVEQFYETALLKLVASTGKSYVVWYVGLGGGWGV